MGMSREVLNVGQLCRERFGVDVSLMGFGIYVVTVAAASDCEILCTWQ
jgi:erythromycin esterase-like protein